MAYHAESLRVAMQLWQWTVHLQSDPVAGAGWGWLLHRSTSRCAQRTGVVVAEQNCLTGCPGRSWSW